MKDLFKLEIYLYNISFSQLLFTGQRKKNSMEVKFMILFCLINKKPADPLNFPVKSMMKE